MTLPITARTRPSLIWFHDSVSSPVIYLFN
jgi:hypothetical protein